MIQKKSKSEREQKRYLQWIARAKAKAPADREILLPQAGYQWEFLTTPADIAIGGGSAGVGKTFSLLIDGTRHRYIDDFAYMIFRRTNPEIKLPGGLWDEARKIYRKTTGGEPTQNPFTWHFPGQDRPRGARIIFSHLQYEDDVYLHHGGQYPAIGFDELTTFTAKQFWYLYSRSRTDIGIRPYIRATTNPQTSGWVKDLLSWYLYPDDHPDPEKAGYPIPERDGVLRWFARDKDVLFWGDNPREVYDQVPHLFTDDGVHIRNKIKSFTFIGGNVYQNKELLKRDPGYIGNLLSLGEEDRSRLFYGCWRYRPGENELYNYPSVLDVFTNDFVEPGLRYITADLAFEGSDLFVVFVWEGFRIAKVYAYEKSPGQIIVQTIKQIASDWRVPISRIAYDRDGVGEFLAGFIPGAWGFKARTPPLEMLGSREGRPNFENLKTQLAYLSAQYIQDAEVYAMPGAFTDWQKDRFIEEVRAVMKREADNEASPLKMSSKAEIKARIKRSPDFWEAFLLRWLFVLRPPFQASTA